MKKLLSILFFSLSVLMFGQNTQLKTGSMNFGKTTTTSADSVVLNRNYSTIKVINQSSTDTLFIVLGGYSKKTALWDSTNIVIVLPQQSIRRDNSFLNYIYIQAGRGGTAPKANAPYLFYAFNGDGDIDGEYLLKSTDTLKVLSVMSNTKTDRFVTQIKQLTAADTVFEFKFDYNYHIGSVTIYDTLGGSPTVDTFYFQRKDTLAPYASKVWTEQQVAYVDLSTRSTYIMPTGSYGLPCVIAGDGYSKTFELYEKLPYIIRVWVTKYSCSNGRSKYVKITGKKL